MTDKETRIPPGHDARQATRVQTRAVRFAAGPLCDGKWVRHVAETAAAAGFNTVIFDAHASGVTMFPSRTARMAGISGSGLFTRREDLLDEVCRAARGEGLCLYAGFDLLRAGVRGQQPRSPIVARRREWLAMPAGTGQARTAEAGGPIFMCPRNRGARDHLAALAAEIAAAYPVNGICLDLAWMPPGACACPACAHGTTEGAPPAPADTDEDTAARADPAGDLVSRVHAAVRTARLGVLTAGRIAPEYFADPWLSTAREWISDGILDVAVIPAGCAPMVAESLAGRHHLNAVGAGDPPGGGGYVLELGESPDPAQLDRYRTNQTESLPWEAEPREVALKSLQGLLADPATDAVVRGFAHEAASLLMSEERLNATSLLAVTDVIDGMLRTGGEFPAAMGDAQKALRLLECMVA